MSKNKKTSFWRRLEHSLIVDEMFLETEKQANHLGAIILICNVFALALILLLAYLGIFPLAPETIFPPTIQAIIEVLGLLLIYCFSKRDAWWLKYLLIIGLVIVYARLDSMLTHKAAILMVIPAVFSSRYFSRRFTIYTIILSTVMFFFSAVWGATHGMINLNIVTMPAGTEFIATGGFLGDAVINAGVSHRMLIENTLLYDYLPKWMMFIITAVISCNIARRGKMMVIDQHKKDMKSARIITELNLATRIQADMLPNTFPAFPDREDFDIYARMDPAKEVGGDFYDFFLIDDRHLCMIIADVSGKGIPAALFMMMSRTILANNVKDGKTPAQILTDTNQVICSNNREEMFITVWLGILDFSDGRLTAANAGHEYPLIKRPGGEFELYKDPHGFVIGGLDGMKYTEYELYLEPGSKLFLYTDGVTEAVDKNSSMFGTEGLLSALNKVPEDGPKQLLNTVRHMVDDFADGEEQADDVTMLCIEYKKSIN